MSGRTAREPAAAGVLWLGPDEWLVVGLPGTEALIVAELEAALEGEHRSIVDVSANRAVVDLRGASRLDLLASGCGLDLDPRGSCATGSRTWSSTT